MKSKYSFLSDSAIYAFSNFAAAGVPFLLLPILTRVLDPSAYGMVAMFTMVVAIITVAIGLNTHGAIMVRYLDENCSNMSEYVTSCFLILVITTLTTIVLILLFQDTLVRVTELPVKWLIMATLVAAAQFLVQVLLTIWQASKQPFRYGVLRLTQALLDGVTSIILVVLLMLSWQGRITSLAITSIFVALIALSILLREGWIKGTARREYAKDALRFGIPLVPHAIGGLMLGMADRFLITNLLDTSSTGMYVVAIQLGLVLGLLVDSFNKAYAPWLMERLSKIDYAGKKQIVFFTYLYFLAILSLAILGGMAAPHFVALVLGIEFQPVGPLIIYIFLGNAFMGMYYMVTNYIFFARRTELLSLLTIIVGLTTVVLTYFMIKTHGISGAAQAFMIGQCLLFICAWIVSNQCVNMPWIDVFRKTNATPIRP